jgi:hypothetical protein
VLVLTAMLTAGTATQVRVRRIWAVEIVVLHGQWPLLE